MDANEKVIQTLKSAGKPMKTGEIAEAAGVEKKEVEKANQEIGGRRETSLASAVFLRY